MAACRSWLEQSKAIKKGEGQLCSVMYVVCVEVYNDNWLQV